MLDKPSIFKLNKTTCMDHRTTIRHSLYTYKIHTKEVLCGPQSVHCEHTQHTTITNWGVAHAL